jgi:hypothetical protein
MKSLAGIYLLCLSIVDQQHPNNVTILHSSNFNFRYLRADAYTLMMVSGGEAPITLKMNSLENSSTVVEVFECVNEVDFSASDDYKKFIANESLGVEHAKTAGHYVIRLPPSNNNTNMQFSRVKTKSLNKQLSSVFLYRYSYFNTNKNPFESIGAESTGITYSFGSDKVEFTVALLKSNKNYKIK